MPASVRTMPPSRRSTMLSTKDRTGWSGCASTRAGTDYAPIHDLRSWSAECDFRCRRMSAGSAMVKNGHGPAHNRCPFSSQERTFRRTAALRSEAVIPSICAPRRSCRGSPVFVGQQFDRLLVTSGIYGWRKPGRRSEPWPYVHSMRRCDRSSRAAGEAVLTWDIQPGPVTQCPRRRSTSMTAPSMNG